MFEDADDWTAIAFIAEEVDVSYDRDKILHKKPPVPSGFHWRGERFRIMRLISSWTDYERRGRMAKNMKEEHLRLASKRGSWGVGRTYFRVEIEGSRVFDLYYDRAPSSAGDRLGHWYLWREMTQKSQR